MERLITCLRAGRPEHTPEAEPVLVSQHGNVVTLTLDDGETLTFTLGELLASLHPAAALREAA